MNKDTVGKPSSPLSEVSQPASSLSDVKSMYMSPVRIPGNKMRGYSPGSSIVVGQQGPSAVIPISLSVSSDSEDALYE